MVCSRSKYSDGSSPTLIIKTSISQNSNYLKKIKNFNLKDFCLLAYQEILLFQRGQMSIISSESGKINRYIFDYSKPQTYLSLMQKVGDSGHYQKKVLQIFILCWFVTGVILLSNSFLFRNRLYDCTRKGIILQDVQCLEYVCSLPSDQWNDFFAPQMNNFNNIATINNYECQDSYSVIILRASTYLGAILGFLIISFFSDNFGRKFSLVLSWIFCVLGSLLVTFGFNITVIGVGLFLSGFGSDAAINITYLYFCQISNNKIRQRYSVIIQIFFTIGAFVATTCFFVIPNWRIIWGLVVTFPAIIILLLIYYYLEDTPHFVIKKGLNVALKSLNRIGKINFQRRQTLEEQDIENVIDFQMVQKFRNTKLTHLDLFRFESLRQKTILCSVIAFMIFGMYYGPVLIIQNIGFNIYITSYIIIASQLLIFIPTYIYIQKIQRKKMGIIIISISIFSSFILTMFDSSDDCGICLQSALQIIMIIIFRASVAFFFAFFEIYICQLFPSRVRGLSFGIITSFGSLSSTFIPILLNYFMDQQYNFMIIFVLTGVVVIGCLTFLPQTLGKPIKQQIQQVQLYINQNNQVKINLFNQKKWRSQRNLRSKQSFRMIRSQKN